MMKKNTKKEDEKKALKKSFKEQWSNPRTKAILKLKMWGIFFLTMFIFYFIAALVVGFKDPSKRTVNDNNEEKQQIEEKVEINIPVLLQKLKESNYLFEFKVVNSDNEYSYIGKKNNEEIAGIVSKENNLISYIVKDDVWYNEKDEEISFDIISESERETLDLNKLIEKIKNYEENNEVKIVDNVYIYDLSDESNKYIISIQNNTNSYVIKIETNDSVYELEYTLKEIIDKSGVNIEEN